ncbi:hypothetical protein [Actinacidiphila glaucinigra]|uniref:hypothetical protein n=1 Tax=Actinacidiphila glaucinigra TaxID=235986 RepID=UPI0036E80405
MAVRPPSVDDALLDRLLALADLPWSYRAFENAFVRNGWHHVGDDGRPVIGWLDAWPVGGHWLELGEYPGCGDDADAVCDHPQCRADCSVVLPFAHVTDGEAPEGWDGDGGAREYDAAWDRMTERLSARLGSPEPPGPRTHEPESASRSVVWSRGDAWIVLLDGDDPFSYGSWQRAGIEVRPRSDDGAASPPGRIAEVLDLITERQNPFKAG